jgi:hypothetical protein
MYEEDDDEAREKQLRNARVMLWLALIGAVVMLPALMGNMMVIAMITFVLAFFGGLGGIRDAARGTDGNALLMYLSLVLVFMPLFNIVPIAYYLRRTHVALNGELAVPAPPAARTRPAPAGSRAHQAPPQSATRPGAPPPRPGARHALSGAIAAVRIAGLGTEDGHEVPEGAPLEMSLGDGQKFPPGSEPVVRAVQGVFAVWYMVDAGDFYTMASKAEMKKAGLTPDQLHWLGMRNLEAQVNGKPGLKLLPQGSFHGLVMGGQFEASLVLVDQLWDGPLKEHAPNAPVVAIPAKDMCAFCDVTSTEGIGELRRIVARVKASGDKIISERLFIRKDGKWREFVEARAADLPPLEFKL